MAARIEIRVDDEGVLAAFDRVEAAGLDLEPLFDRIGGGLVSSTQTRFQTKTDPQGRKWKPLERATIRAKKGDTRILQESGALLRSLTHNATPSYLEVGSADKKAGVHQFGATIEQFARSQRATFVRGRNGRLRFAKATTRLKSRTVRSITIGAHTVTIPARPFLDISEADAKMIVDEADAYIAEAAGGTT